MSSSDNSGLGKLFKSKRVAGLVVAAVIGIYAYAQPILNERYGLNLPAIRDAQTGESSTAADTGKSSVDSRSQSASKPVLLDAASSTKRTESKQTESKTAASQSTKTDSRPRSSGPLADRVATATKSSENSRSSKTTSTSSKPAADADDPNLKYGLLRETSPDRYMSPAGLSYTPGSAEGHRLKHLERHTKDQPNRPGKHGVFDGGMEGALKSIDRAYEKAKLNQRTTKQVDDGRTIYTVDMGGRVGFVGGRDGNRQRKPMARRIRIVLEGTRVITAYPM